MKTKCIKIIGTDCYFQQCWGIGWVDTKRPKEIIAIVGDYIIQYIEKALNNEKCKEYTLSHGTPNITNGVFSLASQRIMVKSIADCTPEEIERLNTELDTRGMYWGEKEITFSYGTKIVEGLYWKSKDEFPIVLDEKVIKYKDLDKCEHGEHIVISGDNGYSHYWSDSVDFSKVKEIINKMFSEEVKSGCAFHNARVLADCELYGYHFDEFGALKINTYSGAKRERVSVVSNT